PPLSRPVLTARSSHHRPVSPLLRSPPLPPALFFFMTRPPPRSTLFPYTTLFRSATGTDRGQHLSTGSLGPLTGGEHHSGGPVGEDRRSTRLNSSHVSISYAVFCLKKKKKIKMNGAQQHEQLSATAHSETHHRRHD